TSDGADVGTSETIHAVSIGKKVEEIMRTVKLHGEIHRYQTFYPVFAPNKLPFAWWLLHGGLWRVISRQLPVDCDPPDCRDPAAETMQMFF
ncbi:MAG: hypothetical protein AAFU53_04125, partial [Cyanobacteria bacterium J06632_3]